MKGAKLNQSEKTRDSNPEVKSTVHQKTMGNEVRMRTTESDIEIIVDEHSTETFLRAETFTELAAAHAAIVLAKSQAAAAMEESTKLKSQLQKLKNDLDQQYDANHILNEELENTNNQVIELDKELAIERTRLDEIRRRADFEHEERMRLYNNLESRNQHNSSFKSWLARLTGKPTNTLN